MCNLKLLQPAEDWFIPKIHLSCRYRSLRGLARAGAPSGLGKPMTSRHVHLNDIDIDMPIRKDVEDLINDKVKLSHAMRTFSCQLPRAQPIKKTTEQYPSASLDSPR